MREIVVCNWFGRFMNRRGWAAFTLGSTVFYWGTPDDRVRRHEAVHVEQARRLGRWRFWAAYLWELARVGYRLNRFEVEAREMSGE